MTRGGWSRGGERELIEFLSDFGPLVAGVDAMREISCVDGARRRLGGARWSNRDVEHNCGDLGRIRLD